jgi:hypothetical protein
VGGWKSKEPFLPPQAREALLRGAIPVAFLGVALQRVVWVVLPDLIPEVPHPPGSVLELIPGMPLTKCRGISEIRLKNGVGWTVSIDDMNRLRV